MLLTPVTPSSHIPFRLTWLVLAVLLASYCGWVVVPEVERPGIRSLPTDAAAAVDAAKWRENAEWAASVGIFRGDLWAESGFTYANLLWGNHRNDPEFARTLGQAQARLNKALDDAPDQSGVWLLLAGLALRYKLAGVDAAKALTMSYYTGPSEYDLMPLRLRVAAQLPAIDDVVLRQMAGRELHLLLARQQKAAIDQAYGDGSLAGKLFIRETLGAIDPSDLGSSGIDSPKKN